MISCSFRDGFGEASFEFSLHLALLLLVLALKFLNLALLFLSLSYDFLEFSSLLILRHFCLMELSRLRRLILGHTFSFISQGFNLSLFLHEFSFKLLNLLLIKSSLRCRCTFIFICCREIFPRLLFLKSTCNSLIDKFSHRVLLIRHYCFPFVFHLFKHFCRLLYTLRQLPLLLHFPRLHGAHHGLLRPYIRYLCIYIV